MPDFFAYLEGDGIDRAKTGHMGRMKKIVLDENTTQHEWPYYEGGEEINVTAMTFTRKK